MTAFDPAPGPAEGALRVALIGPADARARLRAVVSAEGHDVVLEAGAAVEVEAALADIADAVIVVAADPAAQAASDTAVPTVFLGAVPAAGDAPQAFLDGSPSDDELAAALRAVAAGLTVYGPGLRPTTASGFDALGPPQLDEALTRREMEVLSLLALGLPNKAIALELGISEHTAKYHVGAILSKLDAQSRADAVMRAARRGLLPL